MTPDILEALRSIRLELAVIRIAVVALACFVACLLYYRMMRDHR